MCGCVLTLINSSAFQIPATIEDPSVYPELEEAFKSAGYNL